MKTLIFILFPFFLSAQSIRGFGVEIPCPQCKTDLSLIFRSTGGVDLILCRGDGLTWVLHEGSLKPAGFRLTPNGIEVYFDERKIYFTNDIALEGNKRYICSTYGLIKAI